MTLLDFLRLPAKQRLERVLEKGIMLESENETENTFQLFYLNDFFVEININTKKEILDITPFKSGYSKEKYLEKIN